VVNEKEASTSVKDLGKYLKRKKTREWDIILYQMRSLRNIITTQKNIHIRLGTPYFVGSHLVGFFIGI
jgi:hypothetical protein